MKIKFIITYFAASAFLTSCIVPAIMSKTAKTKDVRGSLVHVPVIADLDVKGAKVTGSFTTTLQMPDIENAKAMAVAAALKSSEADILVEPSYSFTKVGTSTTVEVTGYPGTYKNFRSATKEDLIWIHSTAQPGVTKSEDVTKLESAPVTPAKPRGIGIK